MKKLDVSFYLKAGEFEFGKSSQIYNDLLKFYKENIILSYKDYFCKLYNDFVAVLKRF